MLHLRKAWREKPVNGHPGYNERKVQSKPMRSAVRENLNRTAVKQVRP
jgi:hypothetical protein